METERCLPERYETINRGQVLMWHMCTVSPSRGDKEKNEELVQKLIFNTPFGPSTVIIGVFSPR